MSTNPFHPEIFEAWYIGCLSSELRNKPLSRTILDIPLVLYRDGSGRAVCALDRCPHRGVPLSVGSVTKGRLQCAYHGWEFDGDGRCQRVPALVGDPDAPARCLKTFPVVERQGYVWIYATAGPMPDSQPWHFKYADDPRYTVVRYEVRAPASVHAVAENALDVPHTAFLHGGLFRNDANRNRIQARIKRFADKVECEYIGEPRPSGLVGRMLAPGGGVPTHFDRFYLPSVVEVEYQLDDDIHVVVNGFCTPVSADDTRLYSLTAFRHWLAPGWLIRPFVQPVALQIFGQDRWMLELQTKLTKHLGELSYVSTDIDTVGPHILKLMRRAAKGEVDVREEPWVKEIEMEI